MPRKTRHRLFPDFVDDAVRKGNHAGQFPAATLIADIGGFTDLTQTLMSHGIEGAELLAGIMDRVFTIGIEAVESRGGFIAGFSGDAFTALFPDGDLSALAAAYSIQRQLDDLGEIRTKFGFFALTGHIGVSSGPVNWRIIPNRAQHVFWFAGEAIESCAACVSRAGKGEVIFEERLHSRVTGISSRLLADGYRLLTAAPDVPILRRPARRRLRQAFFVPKTIRQMTSPGEFRDVLACFINLRLDDPAWIIARIIPLCHEFGGYFKEVEFGDKGWVVVVLFGAPTIQERMVQRAAGFSLAVRELAGDECRIGLSVGRAFAGFVGSSSRSVYGAVGSSVNLAARLMTAANWGTILLGPLLAEEFEEGYEVSTGGSLSLKGIAVPLTSHELTGVRIAARASSYRGKMVGRDTDLEALKQAAAPIFAGHFAGIMYVYGAAGMGKSRLADAFVEGLQDRAQICKLVCDGILNQPYNAWIYFIRQYFVDDSTGTLEERRERFRGKWAQFAERIVAVGSQDEINIELTRIESIIASLLGLDWEGSVYAAVPGKDRPTVVRFALKSLIKVLALERPVILVLEDFHWIDADSAAAIIAITREMAETPLLILALSRHKDDESKPRLSVDDTVPETALDLNTLTRGEIKALVGSLFEMPTDEELIDFLFDRSEGNPFFAGQLALYLEENGNVALRKGRLTLVSPTTDLPSQIETLLIARLDRLETSLKEVIQTASVIGREFAVKVLNELLLQYHHVSREKESFVRAKVTPSLKKGENERIWNAASEIAYIFSHSLLRDAAYNMQIKQRLKELHRLTAQTLQRLFIEDNESCYYIAEHFYAGEETKEALRYYDRAGKHYLTKYSFSEAYNSLSKALKIRMSNPMDNRIELGLNHTAIGAVLRGRGDYDRALEQHTLAFDIIKAELGGTSPETAQCHADLGLVFNLKGDYQQALDHYHQALDIRLNVVGESNPETAWVYNNIGGIYWSRGNYDLALEYCRKSLDIYKRTPDSTNPDAALACMNLGSAWWSKGEFDLAMDYFRQALEIHLEKFGDTHPTTASSYSNIGVVELAREKYDAALDHFRSAQQIYVKTYGEYHTATAAAWLNIGNALWSKDEPEAALDCFQRALKVKLEVLGNKHPDIARAWLNLGSCHQALGDDDLALDYYRKSLDLRLEILGEQHPDTARSYFHVAQAYQSREEFDRALDNHIKALGIRLETIGERHPQTHQSFASVIEGGIEAGLLERCGEYLSKWKEVCGRYGLNGNAFDMQLLEQRLAFARKPDVETIRGLFNSLTDDLSPEQAAEVHWQIAQMQRSLALPDSEQREHTAGLYRELYKKTPKFEYRKRIEALAKP